MPFAPVGTPAPPSRALPRMAIALLACLALYGIDLACMATVPATGFDFASGFAVPFDLMVFVPAVFYLLVVRRYRLSPLLVLPVIWLGGLVSLQFAAPGKPSLLAPLGLCAVGVELGIAAREVLRLVRRFRTAKASSDNPLDWFSDAFSALARNERVARMAALECVMWYYASASWRRAPHVPHGYRAFSSHRQSGYVAAVGVMLVLIAVETVAAHLLAARFSVAAACVLTALSLYTIDLRDAVGGVRGGHAHDAVALERCIADHVGQYVIGNVEVARYRIVHGIPFTARGCRARQKTC